MLGLIKLLGAAIVILGIIFAIKPEQVKEYIKFWQVKKRLYIGSIISTVIGVIFLLSASECRLTWPIRLIGVLSVAKGIGLHLIGFKKINDMFEWWMNRPLTFLRYYSIAVIVFGLLILYSV